MVAESYAYGAVVLHRCESQVEERPSVAERNPKPENYDGQVSHCNEKYFCRIHECLMVSQVVASIPICRMPMLAKQCTTPIGAQ